MFLTVPNKLPVAVATNVPERSPKLHKNDYYFLTNDTNIPRVRILIKLQTPVPCHNKL